MASPRLDILTRAKHRRVEAGHTRLWSEISNFDGSEAFWTIHCQPGDNMSSSSEVADRQPYSVCRTQNTEQSGLESKLVRFGWLGSVLWANVDDKEPLAYPLILVEHWPDPWHYLCGVRPPSVGRRPVPVAKKGATVRSRILSAMGHIFSKDVDSRSPKFVMPDLV